MQSSIYFDNNATTFIDKETENVMNKCVNLGNPSSTNAKSLYASNIIKEFKDNILKTVGITEGINSNLYEVVVNSCASEGNSYVIQGLVNLYWNIYKQKPHIITSAVEHDSILLCVNCLESSGRCEVTKIKVNNSCIVNPNDVQEKLKPNTILVSIMGANNETGSINPIKLIGDLLKKQNRKIYFHSDMTQYYGKVPLNIYDLNLDFITASIHKIYGPPGVGIVVKTKNINFDPLIYGMQQNKCRGGTENIICIGGANDAVKNLFKKENFIKSFNIVLNLKKYLINELVNKFNAIFYDKLSVEQLKIFEENELKNIVILTPSKYPSINNTVLLSFPGKCNIKLKNYLEDNGVVVSIGSACDASSNSNGSYTVKNMNVSEYLISGVIRVSFGKYNTIKQIDKFLKLLKKIF